jgi:hypothetical protein
MDDEESWEVEEATDEELESKDVEDAMFKDDEFTSVEDATNEDDEDVDCEDEGVGDSIATEEDEGNCTEEDDDMDGGAPLHCPKPDWQPVPQ